MSRPGSMLQNGHLVHGMTALLTSYGMYSQSMNQDFVNHVSKTFAGPFEFLTILCAIATVIYVAIAMTSHYVSRVKRLRHDLLVIVLAIECSISLSFWSVYFYNPQLLFVTEGSKQRGAYLDPLIDACLHLFPAIFLLLEFFLHVDYPFQDFHRHQRLIAYSCSGYTFWLIFLRYKNSQWVYPIIGLLPFPALLILFPVLVFLAVSLFSKLVSWKLRFTAWCK